MATFANFTLYKDTDATLTDTLDPAVNITGWALECSVRKQYGGTELISKTTGAGTITITDATNGVFTVAFYDTDTEDLEPGAYIYNILRTDAGSEAILSSGFINLMATSK